MIILVALFLQHILGWPFDVGICIVLFTFRYINACTLFSLSRMKIDREGTKLSNRIDLVRSGLTPSDEYETIEKR